MLAIVEHKCNVYTSSASVTLHEIYTRERESERESGSEKKNRSSTAVYVGRSDELSPCACGDSCECGTRGKLISLIANIFKKQLKK